MLRLSRVYSNILADLSALTSVPQPLHVCSLHYSNQLLIIFVVMPVHFNVVVLDVSPLFKPKLRIIYISICVI